MTRAVSTVDPGQDVDPESEPAWVRALLAPVVGATYWLDPGNQGRSYPIRIRFYGRRTGVEGKPRVQDRFEVVEKVDGILPGAGLVAITAKVPVSEEGEWLVSAEPIFERSLKGSKVAVARPADPGREPRASPSILESLRRWGTPRMTTRIPGLVKSGPRPFVRVPGSITGSWPALVGLGVTVGLLVQSLLLRQSHVAGGLAFELSVAASLAGFAGSRLWFIAANRKVSASTFWEGMCIQGFIVGAGVVLVGGLVLLRMPIGEFLDASAVGLFFGLAVGRPGCFLTGCCAGRPTTSRWGVWASDQRIGIRRIPIQLWEALIALVIALAGLALISQPPVNVPGAVALGGLTTYTIARQLLFSYRAEPRRSAIGRPSSLVIATLVLVADIVCWAITCL